MKITKKLEYGMLLVLYITKSGRSTIETVAEELDIPKSFLVQIANVLRKHGVLRAVRGSGGGFEIVGEPTVGEIFYLLGDAPLMKFNKFKGSPSTERRALGALMQAMGFSLDPLYRRTVRSLVMDLAACEVSVMETLPETAQVN